MDFDLTPEQKDVKNVKMVEGEILCETKEGISYLTINGVKDVNILTEKTLKQLGSVLQECKENEECRVLIITGAGTKAFSAGADVGIFLKVTQEATGGAEWSRFGQSVLNLLEDLGKPSIAAVNGIALGGGCELALACTFRVASTQAKFGFPEINLGIIPGWGGTQRLARLVGRQAALELLLTGKVIDAHEAYKIGLVSRVVSPTELMPTCEALAKEIIKNSPIAVKLALKALQEGYDLPLKKALVLESTLAGLCCLTEDAKKAFRSFQQKGNRGKY